MERLETLQKVVEFLGSWQERSRKESLVNTFFHQLLEGKKTAAKAALEKIRKSAEPSPWRRGYINALEGIIAASEAKEDRDVFINQLRVEKSDELRRTFLQQSKNNLHADFDRGYFAAWADFIQALRLAAKST